MSLDPPALLGRWSLSRVVEDRLAAEHRDVHGTTELIQETADRIRWEERGTMTWADHSVPVSRTLYVERGAERDGWFVHFADGRPFHPWAVGMQVEHPCTPDHYRGRIEASGDPVSTWSVVWQALGPAKDYVMTTEHTRIAPG